jgi:hypothetical protein
MKYPKKSAFYYETLRKIADAIIREDFSNASGFIKVFEQGCGRITKKDAIVIASDIHRWSNESGQPMESKIQWFASNL